MSVLVLAFVINADDSSDFGVSFTATCDFGDFGVSFTATVVLVNFINPIGTSEGPPP